MFLSMCYLSHISVTMEWLAVSGALGRGSLKLHPLISLFMISLIVQKHLLHSLNHIHIWQMAPQLSCSDICQKWMLLSISQQFWIINLNFENNATVKIAHVSLTPRGCLWISTTLLGCYVWPIVSRVWPPQVGTEWLERKKVKMKTMNLFHFSYSLSSDQEK